MWVVLRQYTPGRLSFVALCCGHCVRGTKQRDNLMDYQHVLRLFRFARNGNAGIFQRFPNMSKKTAIVQSNYIPWKGYFDMINLVDEFILFDDMQYTRRDWRNRNRIKTASGVRWLTIPVEVKGKYFQKIKDTVVSDAAWNRKHWDSIVHSYSRTRHFRQYKETFEELYLGCSEKYLSRINHRFLATICNLLGIDTKITWSMDYRLADGKTERLVDLCKQVGADEYISGPTAKGYMDEEMFKKEGIKLSYMDYSGYPEYNQLYPPFDHTVSIIDLIFNEGPNVQKYMKSF